MPKRKYRRRPKQEIATTADHQPLVDRPFAEAELPLDGVSSIAAVTEVLQALTVLPSDRAKARVLRFVQDYFDEQHGH